MTAIERLREWLDSEPEIPQTLEIPSGSKVHDAVAYAAYLLDKHEDVQAQMDNPTVPEMDKGTLEFRLRTIEADARELLEAMP